MRLANGITFWLVVAVSTASAQTVALPSLHVFSYSGTVEVPDGRAISLGGNRYAASGRSQRGGFFPGPVARSGIVAASGASVHATIIDHDEWDRQVLGGTPAQIVARHHQMEADRTRQARGTEAADRSEEGKSLVRYARTQIQRGRYREARDAYEMAISVLQSPLRELAIAEMRRTAVR